MKRRTFLSQSVPGGLAAAAQTRRQKPPNMVVVVMDDFGIGDFAPLARNLETGSFDPLFVDYLKRSGATYTPAQALEMARSAMPGMVELARGGVVFSNAFASSNLCAPSRSGLLMGRLQNRYGLYQNTDVEGAGVPRGTVLAERLQQAGYATGFIGKWHAGRRDDSLRERAGTGYIGSAMAEYHPLKNGFDYYFGYNHWQCPFYNSEQIWENWTYTGLQERYNTELFTDKAVQFIRGAKKQGKPFFVQVSFHAMHGPLQPKAPDRYFNQFPSPSRELTNFYAHVNAVDEGVAAIRREAGEEWANTLFVFTADNGAPLSMSSPLPGNAPYRGHKGMYIQGGIRVPMLVHWPARIRGGQQPRELASNLDIMPTALDAAGVKLPDDLDGRSMLPMLTGKAAKVHEHLMWAGIHARAWGFMSETVEGQAVRSREQSPGAWVVTDGRYLLRFVTTTPPHLFKDVPDGAPPHYELFDIREDPGETRNLAQQIPQVLESLQRVYMQQARTLPPPTVWRRDRWREMVPEDNVHLKASDRKAAP